VTVTVFDDNGLCCEEGQGYYNVSLEGNVLYQGSDFNWVDQVQLQHFELLTDDNECETHQFCLTVEIIPDNSPQETSFDVLVNDELLASVTGEDSYTDVFGQLECLYVAASDCIELTITDTPFGNGICCGEGSGSYAIKMDEDVIYESDGQYGWGERVTMQYGAVVPQGSHCVVEGSHECLGLVIQFDRYPSEVSYTVTADDVLVLSDSGAGMFSFWKEEGHDCIQVDDEACIAISFSDNWGDGFCCNLGNGYFEVWWAGAQILTQSGDIGSGVTIYVQGGNVLYNQDGSYATSCR